jgi:uncharacterized protein YjaG (DUF416 family)
MWPKLTNINGGIAATIISYANSNAAASSLNAWVRVFSGAVSDEGQNGLVMQSNTNFNLFSRAGEGSIYGNADRSGIIGTTWGVLGTPVYSGVGRALRPSPIITSLNSKEGQDQISRTCEFSITCFSLEQLELMQTYFMEPGYSVGVEWGWNTASGSSNLVSRGNVVNEFADRTLNTTSLTNVRTGTSGEYDVFLGFIVGSTVSNDGENFKVDVKLRGSPALPTYLQSQNRIQVKKSGVVVDPDKVKQPFTDAELEESSKVRDRRFRYMFNELPAFRQTETVKNILNTAYGDGTLVTKTDFINFDKVQQKVIDTFLAEQEFIFFGQNESIKVGDSGSDILISKEKLFSRNRYIKFDLAVRILSAMGDVDEYEIGGKKISFKINIDNSIIGAFPFMFSTKASKLLIPGFLPQFGLAYFLSSEEVTQSNDGKLNGENPIGIHVNTTLSAFHQFGDLNENGLKEKSKYYGYLKNLYVNFDMFKEKIEQKNKNIREIFLDILNEMSSAVDSFWNFQLVESEDKNNNILISVIDENWIGENPNSSTVEFKHSGVGSPFLNSSLDISIPAEMANMIINNRLDVRNQNDIKDLPVGTFFRAERDLFLSRTGGSGGSGTSGTSGASGTGGTPDPSANRRQILLAEENAKIARTVPEVVSAGNPRIDKETSYDLDGNVIRVITTTTTTDPNLTTSTRVRVIQYTNTELGIVTDEELTQASASAGAVRLSKLSSNLEKIDVVPNPTIETMPDFTRQVSSLRSLINESTVVFCLDDTDYFNSLRNYYMTNKGGAVLSQPLPIKYSFTILGNSGIQRGDTFHISGIPSKYSDHGIFQVSAVEHSIQGMRWETTIEGLYRQIQ